MARILGVLLFLACGHAAQAQAADNTLSIQDALRITYQNNPVVSAHREELKAIQELYPQAMAGWHPNVNAETSITSTHIESGNFNNGDGATTKSGSINVEQPLFRGFRTTGEAESAKRKIDSSLAGFEESQQDIFVKAVEAYVDVIRDRQLLSLRQKNKDIFGKEKETVQARFEAGDLTQTDLRQTEAKYANSQADEAVAYSNLLRSEAAFEEITGIRPTEYMEMPTPDFVFPQTVNEMVAMANGQNPRILRTRMEQKAAQSDIKIAESAFYPQVHAFASYLKEYDPQPGLVDESETGAIGVRARINLYEGGRTVSQRREAKFRANQRTIEIRAAEQEIRRDLIALWRRYLSYDTEIAARELEITAAKFSVEGVRAEANAGERTVLDVLEAEQEILTAESNLVEAKRDRALTTYRLAAILGMLTPKKLGIAE